MNKYILGFIILVIVIAGAIVFFSSKGDLLGRKAQATFGDQKISLEVADSQDEREIGLSKKKSLKNDQGMIFLFDEPGYQSFWMNGMAFPIDIIFLNGEKIVTIYKNVQPPASEEAAPSQYYQPTEPANRVIELKAGMADKVGLKEGDTIDISL